MCKNPDCGCHRDGTQLAEQMRVVREAAAKGCGAACSGCGYSCRTTAQDRAVVAAESAQVLASNTVAARMCSHNESVIGARLARALGRAGLGEAKAKAEAEEPVRKGHEWGGGRRPEPPMQDIPPYTGPAGRSFQSFKRWLKNESSHQRGWYCDDDACRICDAWRSYRRAADYKTVERLLRDSLRDSGERETLYDLGFDEGRKVAETALLELATTKLVSEADDTEQWSDSFSQGLRHGFADAVRRNSRLDR